MLFLASCAKHTPKNIPPQNIQFPKELLKFNSLLDSGIQQFDVLDKKNLLIMRSNFVGDAFRGEKFLVIIIQAKHSLGEDDPDYEPPYIYFYRWMNSKWICTNYFTTEKNFTDRYEYKFELLGHNYCFILNPGWKGETEIYAYNRVNKTVAKLPGPYYHVKDRDNGFVSYRDSFPHGRFPFEFQVFSEYYRFDSSMPVLEFGDYKVIKGPYLINKSVNYKTPYIKKDTALLSDIEKAKYLTYKWTGRGL